MKKIHKITISLVTVIIAAANISCSRTDLWSKTEDVGEARYTVTYYPNGATAGTVPVDGGSYVTGYILTVSENTGNLVRDGHIFHCWNTLADGSGTNYTPGLTIQIAGENISLYAIWLSNTCTVTYDSNTATAGTVPEAAVFDRYATVTAAANTGSLVKIPAAGTAEAFKFGGWNTHADGSGETYEAGTDTFTLNDNITLYAKWVPFTVRDIGPAGGYIFYDKETFSDGWRYLEAAPENYATQVAWGDLTASCVPVNGFSDWYPPTKDDLQNIWSNLISDHSVDNSNRGKADANSAGNFNADWYWSVTEDSGATAYAWAQNMSTGEQLSCLKTDLYYFRSIRKF